jgi:ribosomal protein L7/L12
VKYTTESLEVLHAAYRLYVDRHHGADGGQAVSLDDLVWYHRENQKINAIKHVRDASAPNRYVALPLLPQSAHQECLNAALSDYRITNRNIMGLKDAKDWVDAFWEVCNDLYPVNVN